MVAFFDIIKAGDEDVKERSGDRDAVYRYAGAQGTFAAENRCSSGFWVHLRIGRRFILRG